VKKVYLILVIFLIWNTHLYSREEKTNLLCNYLNTYYHDWDQQKFGETIVSDQAQKSINFTIIENNQKYNFETNLMYNWSWVENAKKFQDIVNDGEYNFVANDGTKYLLINLNRYDGRLEIIMGYSNDKNRYQFKESYVCKKTEQKF